MITGQITLQNFTAQALEAKGKKVLSGQTLPEPQAVEEVPVKIIMFKDVNSGLQINAIFSPEDFDQFVENMRGQSRIITAPSKFPRPAWLKRNGGIRG